MSDIKYESEIQMIKDNKADHRQHVHIRERVVDQCSTKEHCTNLTRS